MLATAPVSSQIWRYPLAQAESLLDVNHRWRPQSGDPEDGMVLEAAINGGADIVTHNARVFGTVPARFGLDLLSPAEALRRIVT